ncbi:hypothetical protein Vretifemale_1851 [Volvox reticuliferus]|nr:hypothetical protein Vretifemale_1851 [Volvox reticuliferus]
MCAVSICCVLPAAIPLPFLPHRPGAPSPKQDLRSFLQWAATNLGYPVLAEVEAAPPTAELEPLVEGQQPQLDEVDMGMTYAELSLYGRLRKVARAGPVAMYNACSDMWRGRCLSPQAIATKVIGDLFLGSNRPTIRPSVHDAVLLPMPLRRALYGGGNDRL